MSTAQRLSAHMLHISNLTGSYYMFKQLSANDLPCFTIFHFSVIRFYKLKDFSTLGFLKTAGSDIKVSQDKDL